MTKKIFSFILFLNCSNLLIAQEGQLANKFTLEGRILGEPLKFLILSYGGAKGIEVKDTCYLKENNFSFVGYINGTTSAFFQTDKQKTSSIEQMIFLEPVSMKASLDEDNLKYARVTGSATEHDFEILKEVKKRLDKEEVKLSHALDAIYNSIDKGDSSLTMQNKLDSVSNERGKCKEQQKQVDYAFINSHPGSELSPYLMEYYFGSRKLSLDSAEIFFNGFHKVIQQSTFGKSIHDQIIARKLSATGGPAPPFSKMDISGKEISLSSFKGKSYVLLDFWASWCEPCRAITPTIKEMYQRFHSKGLDIVSISWDSNKKDWMNAITKDSTNEWYNVFADVFQPGDNGLRKKYAIASIPTLILIDKNGVIIGRYRGDGEDGDEMAMFDTMNKIFADR
ncbi:MAG TPA: TlpA disulfide reductase family protein [Chitinophagaceae bacterium]|jgi:thiol-disulfide isomerase/thioredoxin